MKQEVSPPGWIVLGFFLSITKIALKGLDKGNLNTQKRHDKIGFCLENRKLSAHTAHRPNNAAMLTGRTKIAWRYWLHVSTGANHTLQLNTTWEPFQLPKQQLLSRCAQFYQAGKAGIASIWKGTESKYWLLCLTPVTAAAAALAKHTLLLLDFKNLHLRLVQMVKMRHLA